MTTQAKNLTSFSEGIADNGNVGIGETVPQGKLHVKAGDAGSITPNAAHNTVIIEGSGNTGINIFSPDTSYQYLAFGDDSGANKGYVRYQHSNDQMVLRSGSTDTVYINDGKVGIGTGSPAEKVEVNGSFKVGNLKIQNAHGGRIGFNRNTANGAIYDSNFAAFQINGAYAGADFMAFEAYTSGGVGTDAMAIRDNGSVGIGTTSPNSKLEVATSANVGNHSDGAIQVVSSAPIAFVAPSNLNPSLNRWGFTLREGGEGHFGIRDYRHANTRVTIDDGGNVGIGNTNPLGDLHIGNGSSAVSIVLNGPNEDANSSVIYFGDTATSDAPEYYGLSINHNTQTNILSIVNNNENENTVGDLLSIARSSGLVTITNDLTVNGDKINLPTGTSRPTSAVTGSTYFNTADNSLQIYDGNYWGSVSFVPKGSINDPAQNTTELAAIGGLAQYYFDPLETSSPFQLYAASGLSDLGTIPSGGPSWVYNHNSIVLVEKGSIGTNSIYKMSQSQYLNFFEESITRNGSGRTLYLYWAVFYGGTLHGITRTWWTGATYSTWASNHDTDGSPSGTAHWDVWKTGSGTPSGSYTVSDDQNMIRSVLPQQSFAGGASSYGIHYKRVSTGEHYPWHGAGGNIIDNGYFNPSTSYSMTGSGYTHYIYLSDT